LKSNKRKVSLKGGISSLLNQKEREALRKEKGGVKCDKTKKQQAMTVRLKGRLST